MIIYNVEKWEVLLQEKAPLGVWGFYFALYLENADTTLGQQLTNGNLYMTGTAYTNYETNQDAWNWIAQSLNVTVTGDYIPPAPITNNTQAATVTAPTTAE